MVVIHEREARLPMPTELRSTSFGMHNDKDDNWSLLIKRFANSKDCRPHMIHEICMAVFFKEQV